MSILNSPSSKITPLSDAENPRLSTSGMLDIALVMLVLFMELKSCKLLSNSISSLIDFDNDFEALRRVEHMVCDCFLMSVFSGVWSSPWKFLASWPA